MRVIQNTDPCGTKETFVFEIEDSDTKEIKYEDFEKMLIQECTESNSIADKLLMLEMIARKVELNKLSK